MAEFKYEIVEKLGVISQGKGGWERQLNLVSWSDREPKYDIRDWSPDGTKMGKGILVAPTTHGNILVGPTAKDIEGKEDVATTFDGLNEAWNKALLTIPTLNKRGIIESISGIFGIFGDWLFLLYDLSSYI